MGEVADRLRKRSIPLSDSLARSHAISGLGRLGLVDRCPLGVRGKCNPAMMILLTTAAAAACATFIVFDLFFPWFGLVVFCLAASITLCRYFYSCGFVLSGDGRGGEADCIRAEWSISSQNTGPLSTPL